MISLFNSSFSSLKSPSGENGGDGREGKAARRWADGDKKERGGKRGTRKELHLSQGCGTHSVCKDLNSTNS